MSTNEHKAAKEQLVKEGMTSYLDALVAVREFQREIISQSRRAVEVKLNDLTNSMGISLDTKKLTDYVSPALDTDELGQYGYISVSFTNSGVWCCFGAIFEREDTGSVPYVCAMMALGNARQRDFVLDKCRQIDNDVANDWQNEVDFFERIDPGDVDHFGEKLQSLIDKWVKVWKAIGGVRNLPK